MLNRDPHTTAFLNVSLLVIITVTLILYKFLIPKRNVHPIILFLLIASVPMLSLFRAGTFQAGDLGTHTAHLIDFYQNLKEGVVVPRWAGDLCGQFGCPVFEFEYILPYYIGSVFHVIGFSFLTSIKLVLAVSFLLSGVTMYFFAKEECTKEASFVASVVYLFAPYHIADIHFRGSVGEVTSFVFIPLLFLFGKRLIVQKNMRYFFLTSFSLVLLLLSHASIAMVSAVLVLFYAVTIPERKRSIIILTLSLFYGLVLSAFYWLPAQKEISYTWQSLTSFGDFKHILEYLVSPVAFGFLFQGHHGEIRPIVGYVQLFFVVTASILLLRKKVKKSTRPLLMYLLVSFFILFFMMQKASAPIWSHVPLFSSIIMVWRLLVPISFVTALIAGIVMSRVKNRVIFATVCFITICVTSLNWANRKMVPVRQNLLHQENEFYTEYYKAGDKRYEERRKRRAPIRETIVTHPPKERMMFLRGNGSYTQTVKKQQIHEYVVNVTSDAVIQENTYYFPGWKVSANNKKVAVYYENQMDDSFGTLTFFLKKGLYKLNVVYAPSPIRSIGENVSVVGMLAGIAYSIFILQKRIKNT